jgi:hypothetical protein
MLRDHRFFVGGNDMNLDQAFRRADEGGAGSSSLSD